TRDRKPVGMAYVTMTLVDPEVYGESHDSAISITSANGHSNGTNGHSNGVVHTNGKHPLPVANQPQKPGEITITRRLYRSGESEYLINGHTARLRDIQDLFMGSGLGPESYAIIEQG